MPNNTSVSTGKMAWNMRGKFSSDVFEKIAFDSKKKCIRSMQRVEINQSSFCPPLSSIKS